MTSSLSFFFNGSASASFITSVLGLVGFWKEVGTSSSESAYFSSSSEMIGLGSVEGGDFLLLLAFTSAAKSVHLSILIVYFKSLFGGITTSSKNP